MKNIGVLTFHNVPNYGAVLQAYALRSYIMSNYSDTCVSIVDYRCPGNNEDFSPQRYFGRMARSSNKLKSITKHLILEYKHGKAYRQKYKSFQDFCSTMLHIAPYPKEGSVHYDAVFLGSDQIWNPRITEGFQDAYFGQDTKLECTISASYAASCGDVNELDITEIERLVEKAGNLDFLAVRESSLHSKLLERKLRSVNVADPTLLLTKDDYVRGFELVTDQNAHYVLVYELQPDKALMQAAREVASRLGLSIKTICGHTDMHAATENGTFNASPKDFLQMMLNADCVLTNSFHGVAFSLIFQKDFYVVLPRMRKSRVQDLLNEAGLASRIWSGVIEKPIVYLDVQNCLTEILTRSKEYIRNVMEALDEQV